MVEVVGANLGACRELREFWVRLPPASSLRMSMPWYLQVRDTTTTRLWYHPPLQLGDEHATVPDNDGRRSDHDDDGPLYDIGSSLRLLSDHNFVNNKCNIKILRT